MQYFFGDPWDVPAVEEAERVPEPYGELCAHCGEAVARGDQGWLMACVRSGAEGQLVCQMLPWHRECQFRNVAGGLAHQYGRCTCCGGCGHAYAHLSLREEARRVWALYYPGDRPGFRAAPPPPAPAPLPGARKGLREGLRRWGSG